MVLEEVSWLKTLCERVLWIERDLRKRRNLVNVLSISDAIWCLSYSYERVIFLSMSLNLSRSGHDWLREKLCEKRTGAPIVTECEYDILKENGGKKGKREEEKVSTIWKGVCLFVYVYSEECVCLCIHNGSSTTSRRCRTKKRKRGDWVDTWLDGFLGKCNKRRLLEEDICI